MNLQEKGKMFDDGVVRWYDKSRHTWVTKEEIDKYNSGAKFINGLNIAFSVVALLVFFAVVLNSL